MDNPEEHHLWALHNLPTIAGTGALSHPAILRRWSKHLVEAGCFHISYIARLADENGNIHISKLPKQQIKKIPAIRGPRHAYNNATTWVDVDREAPAPMRLPDPAQFTIQENHALVNRLEELGIIRPAAVPEHVAEEVN